MTDETVVVTCIQIDPDMNERDQVLRGEGVED